MKPAKFQGVAFSGDEVHLVVFPPDGDHAVTIKLTLADQQQVLRSLTERLVERSCILAGIRAGHLVDKTQAP